MQYTQLLSFEITTECNIGELHSLCPNRHPERYARVPHDRPMTDEQILGVAAAALAGGFSGFICFHHYCEPLCDWPRVRRLVLAIREQNLAARFLLWTNGLLFPDDLSEFAGLFEVINVTDHFHRDWSRIRPICAELNIVPGGQDWRLSPPFQQGREPCLRPWVEIILDYYGNLRPCCWDWQGTLSVGSLHDTPWPVLWGRWKELRQKLAGPPMAVDAPPRCLTCGTRCVVLPCYDGGAKSRADSLIPKSLNP